MPQLNCILLVDDDETTNFFNKYQLEEANICNHIFVANNGLEALNYLSHKGEFENNPENYPKPDLILLDINMPVMDGFEFLEQYGQLPEGERKSIIISMLTTSIHEKDKNKASLSNLVHDYLNKPLEIEDLSKVISKHFN
jgi:CheY-like chemotaxis protein